jgi:ADP-ribose pyrophosphatase YjhB (NUDIX family)
MKALSNTFWRNLIMNRKDFYYDTDAPEADRIVPAVSVVILQNNQILLQKRSDNRKWALPGGNVDSGESVAEAVIREVKEETGLDVEIDRLTGVYSDPNHIIAYADGEVRQQFSLCFQVKVSGGELQKSEESTALSWVPLNKVQSYNLHPAQLIRIEDVLKNSQCAFIR